MNDGLSHEDALTSAPLALVGEGFSYRFSIVLLWGVLAGLIASETLAAPPAPVPPLLASAVRFADNGNGTITDSLTGLVWLKNANCFGAQTWSAALSAANSLASDSCGLSDGSTAGQWRLPNRNELQSLIDYTASSPALPAGHPFVGVQPTDYWSSSTYAPNPSNAWRVGLDAGTVPTYNKGTPSYVWPVRGGL